MLNNKEQTKFILVKQIKDAEFNWLWIILRIVLDFFSKFCTLAERRIKTLLALEALTTLNKTKIMKSHYNLENPIFIQNKQLHMTNEKQ